jgi:hypothetical protein
MAARVRDDLCLLEAAQPFPEPAEGAVALAGTQGCPLAHGRRVEATLGGHVDLYGPMEQRAGGCTRVVFEAGSFAEHARVEQALASIAVVEPVLSEPDGLGAGTDPRLGQSLLQADSDSLGKEWIERGCRPAPDELVERSLLTRRESHRAGW